TAWPLGPSVYSLREPHSAARDVDSFPERRSSDLLGTVADAVDLEHAREALPHALHHVVDQHARETMHAARAARVDNMVQGVGKRSEEHTSEFQSLRQLVWRLLLAKKKAWSRRRRR